MNATQEVKVLSTVVYEPWSHKLANMDIEGILLVDLKSASTVRGIISARMPIYEPEMKFETKKIKVLIEEEEVSVIEVKRTA